MKTERKCRGTGPAVGHGCKEMVPQIWMGKRNRIYGIGQSCGCYQKWLQTPEGQEKISAAILKVTKPRRDFEAFEKEEKERKSLATLLNNTLTACHNYIKARDKGRPCVSCGEPYRHDHQAGHCFKAELYSTLKFNEFNINGQCVGCNIHKGGNESAYVARLPERIGKQQFDELMRLSKLDHKIDFKWDRQELIETRKYYQQKLKELKSGISRI